MEYLNIQINRSSHVSLSRQIIQGIKNAVLSGNILPGDKLPSTRVLAGYLNVARNVVLESYDQLLAEGYVYSVKGAGTYICKDISFHRSCMESEYVQNPSPSPTVSRSLEICFRTGIPDLSEIPVQKWAQIYHKIALDIDPTKLDYQNPCGDEFLRTELSLYLNRARGTSVSPEQILITNGAAQSFDLLSQLVLGNEYALMEDPISYGVRNTLAHHRVKLQSIRIDEYGMTTSALPQNSPKLIFTTPNHQFPTGSILPAGRRIEMIKYAQQHNCYIVEDDYDSEFRFDGSPIQSMQFLDPEHVIYVGTFSKTLMPALRIGYMVLPPSLYKAMYTAKYISDLHTPILEQLTLARFLSNGSFERHIRKMRKLYLKKRNHLAECLDRSFGHTIHISGAQAGLHFVTAFENIIFQDSLMDTIHASGLQVTPVTHHCFTEESRSQYADSLIFGYSNTRMEDMERGISLLASCLSSNN